ncbi:5-formyltetrahydrofolate cyclo-ligase [Sphingomonas sp. C3-2]|uniref:5-formyltetrahydrofolate cyclo-ligase n=1 Tax=Sphingomonas sp. C3-2 TaxID=3062169 RepID=UPI00294B86D2|nr:5-formyltetrahydrofolate cyclo-ligase [Sphingomonas sp. C3-2]WOK37183.1 5-formyltetrahydrofolate cyclo-ligase [Sphingomonas sp. C3-2]
MDKKALRSELKARRGAFAAAQPAFLPAAAPFALPAQFAAWLETARCIAGYIPIQNEADPLPLLACAAAQGHATALPHITTRTAPMRFLYWKPGTALATGPMGLSQPAEGTAETAPDIIITPLVGFDRRLHRIGYGAGFYDRAFAEFPHAKRIGLAWSVQEVDAVPNDPWDMQLDAVWTEREWIYNGDGKA